MADALRGKVVVVTGGTAGLGRAAVRAFARRGAHVGILARGQERLDATQREVESLGQRALGVRTDVADAGEVEAAADRIEREIGPIDIWVNNAMTSVFAPLKETKPDEFHRVTEVTYLGFVYGTMAALKRMLPRDSGKIIQVGSALAARSIPLQAAYCGAKHAIRGFTDSLRSELIHDRSRVQITMVQMPAMNTPQFAWVRSRLPHKAQPVPPIYQPEVGAEAIVWAALHSRRELYVGMPTLKAIMGNKVAPGMLDRYLATHAYSGQQTGEPADPNSPDNLYEPVGGAEIAAHGSFDGRSRERSPELWFAKHKRTLLSLAGAGIGLVGAVMLGRRIAAHPRNG
jgi:NAD(P)-dependent dehydrogenase (short-subunit alcohol dehydrogenase family)